MYHNDMINEKIREMINENRNAILECKGTGDSDYVTYDGIVLEGDKSPDLLYLLKEANDGRNSTKAKKVEVYDGFSFVDQVRKEWEKQKDAEPKVWKNLCYWSRAYKDAFDGTPKAFNELAVKRCGGILKECSIVNIKKVPGAEKTKDEEFVKTISNEVCQKLIRDEIELIMPRVVVCCGTFEAARKIYSKMIQREDEFSCGVKYFVSQEMFFVDFIHPSQQGAAARYSMTYAYAKEVFRDLVAEMRHGVDKND